MGFTVNRKRAGIVVQRLHDGFQRRDGLLSAVDDLVENQIPPGVRPLTREHASFLFYIVANDHGMRSSLLYKRAKDLFCERPELFESVSVVETFTGPEDSELLGRTGHCLGTRYPRETAKSWYLNSERLNTRFGGDALSLFQRFTHAGALLNELKGFRGYGPKTAGMLLRAISGLGFVELDGLEQIPVPVDIHDARIACYTGVVDIGNPVGRSEEDYRHHIGDIQLILRDACVSQGIPWLDVDRALWLTGSQGCVKKDCCHCCLQDLCHVGSKELREPVAVRGVFADAAL